MNMKHALRALSLGAVVIALMTTGASAAPPAAVVIVYPLTAIGTPDDRVGEQIASLIAQQAEASGSVEVRAASTSVGRGEYVDDARKLGADYYLSGFVTKISGQLSVVEQLVSTLSNTTVWSNNVRLVTVDDARAQGDLIRTAVLGHSGRALLSLPDVSSKKTALQAPPAGPQTFASKPADPSRSFAVLLTGGSASSRNRAYADTAIVKALRARGFFADLLSDPVGDLSILGPALCAASGAGKLVGGKMSVEIQPDREINQWATADFDMTVYDCVANRTLGSHSGSGAAFNWNWAVDQAVSGALRV